jgi:hypothetical protein
MAAPHFLQIKTALLAGTLADETKCVIRIECQTLQR